MKIKGIMQNTNQQFKPNCFEKTKEHGQKKINKKSIINLFLFVLIKTSTNLWQFYLVELKKAKQEAT